MTAQRRTRRSVLDLPLETAHARIAELHAAARDANAQTGSGRGTWVRARAALGRRLIALGAALAPEEGLSRRASRP